MRIRCSSVETFLQNVEKQDVYNKTIYVDYRKEPFNAEGDRDATIWKVSIEMGAVLIFPDEGQALVQGVAFCGLDRDLDDEFEGSKEFKKMKQKIEVYCDEYGLMVRPGVVDF